MSVRAVRMNNGVEIPQLGLGTARLDDAAIRRLVAEALDVGYRMIDTAAKYENETGVGQGIADSGLDRDQVFVTTKLRGADQGAASTERALEGSLRRLGLDHVDLYLIHWPLPRVDKYVESWLAMERLLAAGKTRAVGVSNFRSEHLDRLAAASSTVPALNQIEIHPKLQQVEQVADDERRGIVTESWAPLGNGSLLADPVITGIAAETGHSPAQVVLAWHLRRGLVVMPKASRRDRLTENLAAVDVTLTDAQLTAIAGLEAGWRSSGQDPAVHEEF